MTRRLAAALALLAALFAAALALAGPALAHASVVGSDPVDGSRLKTAPHVVTITFDEPVGLDGVGYLHVTDQNGNAVDAAQAFHPGGVGSKIADTLTPHLGDGTYTASYRVISADSHPVAGVIRFVVGNGPLMATGGSGGGTTNGTVSAVFDVSRWISYGGFALLGGIWLVLTVWPEGRSDRRAGRLVWTGWTAVVLGAVGELLMQGAYTAGDGLGRVFDWSLLDDTLHGTYGQLHSVRLVLLGVLALVMLNAWQADGPAPRWEAGALLAGGIALTFSATGHADTTSPSWLSVPLDMAHLLAMSAWLGGLAMLAVCIAPRRDPDELRAVLPVFSRVAFSSVFVLASTGTYAAFRGIGTADAVFTTTYGLLVIGKIVLFLGLVGLGNLSRQVVQRHYVRRPVIAYAMTDAALLDAPAPPVVASPGVHVERLRRTVWVETVIGLVVLALTAVLVAEPRGKEALVAQYRSPVTASAPFTRTHDATVTATPGVHGLVQLTVDLGASYRAVSATATQQQAKIGPLPVRLQQESTGVYTGSVTMPVAGAWQIELTVTESQFDAVTTDTTIHLH